MALLNKYLRYVVIYTAATSLSACVIAPNDHPSQKGYYNNSGYNNIRNNNNVDNNISEKAQNACLKRMGHVAQIQQISDLKPGWFEDILLNPHNGHKAACTVNQTYRRLGEYEICPLSINAQPRLGIFLSL